MLVTLDLISTNVYNSVKAPTKRGFSYIEIWILGQYLPIIIGIVEYGLLLAMKRFKWGSKCSKNIINVKTTNESNIEDQKQIDYAETSKIIDKWAFNIVFAFIVLFNCFYWSFVILM